MSNKVKFASFCVGFVVFGSGAAAVVASDGTIWLTRTSVDGMIVILILINCWAFFWMKSDES